MEILSSLNSKITLTFSSKMDNVPTTGHLGKSSTAFFLTLRSLYTNIEIETLNKRVVSRDDRDDGINGIAQDFRCIVSKQMVGILITVWVRVELRPHIRHPSVSCVGCGVMGCLGNKKIISLPLRARSRIKCAPETSEPIILANASDVSHFGYFQRSSVKEFVVFAGRTVASRTPPSQRQYVQREGPR
ncbi:unnamed protein product [Microthlaspi erraticum]|uniref:Uncharacterized protein n=1 Tax=Microthlaspi erraticum TaxID=1685480 RepID=A0A6D2KAM6_9BRAS|nr:unnamed protein product [Microthlaspi erraticum]CAA7050083.1 unnamed protein product [Microthlaspi erraticum]